MNFPKGKRFKTVDMQSVYVKMGIVAFVVFLTTMVMTLFIIKAIIGPQLDKLSVANGNYTQVVEEYKTSVTKLQTEFDKIQKSLSANTAIFSKSKMQEIKMLSANDKVVIGGNVYKIIPVKYELSLTNIQNSDLKIGGAISNAKLPVGSKIMFTSEFPDAWSQRFDSIFDAQLTSQKLAVVGEQKDAIPVLIYTNDQEEIKKWGTRVVTGVTLVKLNVNGGK